MKKKIKERKIAIRKGQIGVISNIRMTPDQQASFSTASDALLFALIQMLDRRAEGELNGTTKDQVVS